MHLPWEPTPASERRLLRGGRTLNGVHAVAIQRQLAWAKEFAEAGDLASALDACSDAGAFAQELGHEVDAAGIAGL
jgi:hypothetical protein